MIVRWLTLAAMCPVCLGLVPAARASAMAVCAPESVVVDTSVSNEPGELIWGMAWGQTFVATDTLVTAVTVWRMAPEHNDPIPMKFWITEVDSSERPHTHLVVYDGPTLSFTSPDSTRPTAITYTFDPPISLPRPSNYCFWVQETCSGWADLLVALQDDYAGGHLWETFRSDFEGCILRDYPESFPFEDLVFSLVFCNTHTTAVHQPTWGELKARYR